MELYNKKDTPTPPNQDPEAELHNEGIDLVGSGIREENEFTGEENTSGEISPEPASTVEPTPSSVPEKAVVEQKTEIEKPKPAVPPPAPVPAPAPIPASPASNDPSIKSIRTFKTDAEEAVRHKNISAVDIAVAEQKKREATPIQYENGNKSHAGIFVAAVVIVILALGAGWYFWFNTSQGTEKEPVIQVAIETILPYSKGSTLLLNDESDPLVLVASKLEASNAGLGKIYALVPVLYSTSTEQAPISAVFGRTNMPSRLERSLAPNYMIGTYTYDLEGPFIILKNTFFQNAFAGMLEWEKDMRNDLLPLIRVSFSNENPTAENTDSFGDIVISNIDTRVLRNSEGKVILAYAFANTQTIVITTNETTLKYVLDRLLTVRSVQ